MSKRKSTSNFATPSKIKKENGNSKIKLELDESDSENEVDQTLTSFTNSPDEMLQLIYSYLEYVKAHPGMVVKNLEKSVNDWAQLRLSNGEGFVDTSEFCNDYRRYLKNAMKISNLSLHSALEITISMLESEKGLEFYPDFPSRPPQKVQFYIKDKCLAKKVADIPAAYEKLKNEDEEYLETLEKKLMESKKNYVDELKKFTEAHRNLTETQQKAITSKIKNSLKSKTPSRGENTKKSVKKEPVTAYTLWLKTMGDKYTDLPEDKRNEKLKKKYGKLSEAEIRLLETLALQS